MNTQQLSAIVDFAAGFGIGSRVVVDGELPGTITDDGWDERGWYWVVSLDAGGNTCITCGSPARLRLALEC